ncbi:MAG: glutamate 5-kinase [Desulfobacterales bacterium]|nr:glutamate 5-kinase [Desulfobacterales bacterium]
MKHDKGILKASKVWVVKIGSALLTHPQAGLNTEVISHLVDQIITLRQQGIAVVLVSSGSIAEGLRRLKIPRRPKEVHKLQAAAAAGQMGLVHSYALEFKRHEVVCAQILLTHADLANRMRYLNARRTMQTLLEMGAVPIVNENDTVVTEEIRADNDTLGALVANLIEADALVLLTDQNGLYTADPRQHGNAELVHIGDAGDPELSKMAGDGGALGTGGMITKLNAAGKAARSGTLTIIVNGQENDILQSVLDGKKVGTWLFPRQQKIAARKQWIAGQANLSSRLVVDPGAATVLQNEGRSLLPIGIKEISGEFVRGDIVSVCALSGEEIARGIVNYSSPEAHKIIGRSSSQIGDILGYVDDPEMIHRDNLVVY